MTSLADRSIASLRTAHDHLADVVSRLTDEQLAGPSGATEWTLAQVLSHLGSGAEITLAGLRASLAAEPAPDQAFNLTVWDRWDSSTPRQQADGFVEHDERLVAALEGLSADQRASLSIAIGFLPEPLPLVSFVGLRLQEVVLHEWDVDAALDPAATLPGDFAELLLEHLTDGLRFFVGFIGKADRLDAPVRVALEGSTAGFTVDDSVQLLTHVEDPTATFVGPPESAVRLLTGRLRPDTTPADVHVVGAVGLDDLRAVFPGY